MITYLLTLLNHPLTTPCHWNDKASNRGQSNGDLQNPDRKPTERFWDDLHLADTEWFRDGKELRSTVMAGTTGAGARVTVCGSYEC